LFGSVFRYGAVELARFVKLAQQLPCLVYHRVGAGNSLLHFLKSGFYLRNCP